MVQRSKYDRDKTCQDPACSTSRACARGAPVAAASDQEKRPRPTLTGRGETFTALDRVGSEGADGR
ncbi:hypothetical protein GCM10009734_20060 [Nonomuraea bangladeshensis]